MLHKQIITAFAAQKGTFSVEQLCKRTGYTKELCEKILNDLISEGILANNQGTRYSYVKQMAK